MERSIPIPDLSTQSAKELLSGLSFEVFLAFLLIVCIITRTYSGFRSSFRSVQPGEARVARTIPYWIPYIGHALSFGLWRRGLLENARDNTAEPVFGLYICGRKHNMITSPSLAKGLLEQESSISAESFANRVMERVFGGRRRARKLNRADFIQNCDSMEFQMKEPHASESSSATIREIKRNIPNLLSFCPSIVDQALWERMSKVALIDASSRVCEVNLFALVRNFVAINTMTAIMGSDFMEALPNTADDLWKFNNKFNPMAMGIQRWIPFPGLITAYRSRRRLLQGMEAFHSAFTVAEDGHDPGFDWREMDEVSGFIQTCCRQWKEAGLKPDAMAPESLAILWAMNTKLITIIFWNLMYILSDGQYHSRILKEIAPYSRASRPDSGESGFRIREPPQLHLDVDRLLDSCPLLKASYFETLRLRSSPVTYRKITKDFKLTESEEDAELANRKSETYQFKAGDFIAVPHTLYNTDERYFEDANEFNPARFLKETSLEDSELSEKPEPASEKVKLVAETPKLWFMGAENSASKDGKFAERIALAFIASLLTMWDIKPANEMGWKIPMRTSGGLVYEPWGDVRARMESKI
ncbi:hypothetical protein FQN53_005411 [Emmonsiellopsis sp. PD_33]|nr:hypothetical protein FQN53_005411 [Emmonsiellopsis sp. PD_33]